MTADVLAPWVARSSAAMLLAVLYKQVLHVEKISTIHSQQFRLFLDTEMVWNPHHLSVEK